MFGIDQGTELAPFLGKSNCAVEYEALGRIFITVQFVVSSKSETSPGNSIKYEGTGGDSLDPEIFVGSNHHPLSVFELQSLVDLVRQRSSFGMLLLHCLPCLFL